MQLDPLAQDGAADVRLAGFYGRVSGPDDVSIDIQLAICREFAERDGYRIPAGRDFIFQDVNVSGSTLSRDGFDRLKKVVTADQARFDRLYVRESARFGRWDDPRQYDYHAILFENHGVAIYFCDGEGRLDFTEKVDVGLYLSHTVTNVKNAQERSELKKKMRRARRHHAIDGYYPGGTSPYGFERVLVDIHSREVVRAVPKGERLHIAGCRFLLRPLEGRERDAVRFIYDSVENSLSFRQITAELNRLGYPAPNGFAWLFSRVRDIARDPIYMGTLTWGRYRRRVDLSKAVTPTRDGKEVLVIPGFIKNPPITPEQFHRVQAILDANTTLWNRRRACAPKYLFSGLVRCPICGLLYSGFREPRSKRLMYRHNSSDECRVEVRTCPEYRKYIRSDDLEAFLCTQIRELLSDPDLLARVQAEIRCNIEGDDLQNTMRQVRDLKERIDGKAEALKTLKKNLDQADNATAQQIVIASINSAGKAIEGMQEELDGLLSQQHHLATHLEQRVQLLSDPAALLEELDSDSFEVRRAVLERLVEWIHARATTKEVVIALRYA